MMATKNHQARKGRITLRDVITHIQGVEQSLSAKIDGVDRRLSAKIDNNTRAIEGNTMDIRDLRIRIDALEEDLTATIKDTMKIRRHVGIAVEEE